MSLNNLKYFLVAISVALMVYSCANKAQGPTGGPKDETPPRVMKSTPENGALNYKKKQVQIFFDENISVEKVAEQVIISPPQIKPPDVKAGGKQLIVNFNEELLDSTTYTINFGNAIVDLNEKNPLKNYHFAFSTGNEIDTLKISGTLINAEDLNPLSGILVGIYLETDDEVFLKKPFLRIGKTDETGRFSIDNVKAGTYKIFALGDTNRDYFFQPGEGLAFNDSQVTPTFRIEQSQDTVWKDSVEIDSVRFTNTTRFLPDDLLFRFFKESKKRQYFVKSERKQPQSFSLYFNTTLTELPEIKPLNFDWEGKYLLQKNNTTDSLTYWLTDSLVWKTDTLEMTVTYLKSDSLYQLVSTTDTVSVSMRKARTTQRTKTTVTDTKVEAFKFTTNVSSAFDVYRSIQFRFDAPLADADLSRIKLYQKVDTIRKPLPVNWRQVDSTMMNYSVSHKWEPEKSYELSVDSAAFRSIYNKVSDKLNSSFKIRSLDEYSSLKISLATYDSLAVIQVLDTKDVVVATKPAVEKGTLIEYLKPGDYYVRMFIDSNANGIWDPGDLSLRRQPEEVFYYPKKLTLMANWEFEETWNFREIPLLEQKPAELKKDGNKK